MNGKVRAKAHTDLCALTFLPPSKQKGLQVLEKQTLPLAFGEKKDLRSDNQKWLDVPYIDDALICNIGQTLSIKLNGLLPPTVHRVRNPSAEDAAKQRIAMPFFYHFAGGMNLAPFLKAIQERGTNLFPNAHSITVKQYVEAPSEFHENRAVCRPGEHPSIFLKEKLTLA